MKLGDWVLVTSSAVSGAYLGRIGVVARAIDNGHGCFVYDVAFDPCSFLFFCFLPESLHLLPDDFEPLFDPSKVLDAVARFRVSVGERVLVVALVSLVAHSRGPS